MLVPFCGFICQGSRMEQNRWMMLIYLFYRQECGEDQTMILHHSLERKEVTNDNTVRGATRCQEIYLKQSREITVSREHRSGRAKHKT